MRHVWNVAFQYDAGEAWQANLKGRLAKISYKLGQGGTGGGQEPGEEFFSYTSAGLVTRKDWRMARQGRGIGLTSSYGYDAEGRRSSMTYPATDGVTALALEYRYDALSRLQRVATQGGGTRWADNAQYGAAGELTSLTWNNWTETRSYNALGQLTRQTIAGTSDIEYVFSATQNDGRITQRNDYVTGEQVVYQYDALARLVNATTGSTGPQWGYSYSFDGFGNLLQKNVTKGSVPTLLVGVDPTTNRINSSGYGYSTNGNLTSAPGGWAYTYDQSNRMTYASGPNGNEYYSYDVSNKRVYRRKPDGTETIFNWGAGGELLGEFALSGYTLTGGTLSTLNIYFGGKLIRARDQGVVTDRLGSVTYRGTTRINYYPYGEEQPTVTSQDNFKFGTYFRDGTTGLDYAQNRYFSGTFARFQTADPFGPSARPHEPASWNRYSYVIGDPANAMDPSGLDLAGSANGMCGAIAVYSSMMTGPPGGCNTVAATAWSVRLDTWSTPPSVGLSNGSGGIQHANLSALGQAVYSSTMSSDFWAGVLLYFVPKSEDMEEAARTIVDMSGGAVSAKFLYRIVINNGYIMAGYVWTAISTPIAWPSTPVSTIFAPLTLRLMPDPGRPSIPVCAAGYHPNTVTNQCDPNGPPKEQVPKERPRPPQEPRTDPISGSEHASASVLGYRTPLEHLRGHVEWV